jgi:hypothetical protein
MQNISAGFLFSSLSIVSLHRLSPSSLSIVSLAALSPDVSNRQVFDPVNRKYVALISDFGKHLFTRICSPAVASTRFSPASNNRFFLSRSGRRSPDAPCSSAVRPRRNWRRTSFPLALQRDGPEALPQARSTFAAPRQALTSINVQSYLRRSLTRASITPPDVRKRGQK